MTTAIDAGARLEAMMARASQLSDQSVDFSHAFNRALLEHRISEEWPPAWGNKLRVLIYGDFQPPKTDVRIDQLGITVYQEKQENTVIASAMCVLAATVDVGERSIDAIRDAIGRINLLLGAWTLTTFANCPCGWWSYVTHGTITGAGSEFSNDALLTVTDLLLGHDPLVLKKVNAALYWIRAPHGMVRNGYDVHVFRMYSGYWNAFECLVDAVHLLRPEEKSSRQERQARIDKYVQERDAKLTIADIDTLYSEHVNRGFVGKAKHALRVCFDVHADSYISECFTRTDKENRLCDVRNAINHGSIDAENPEERLRIDARLSKLQLMLLQILGYVVPCAAPAIEAFTGATKSSAPIK